MLFHTSNSESISAWREGKHIRGASPKAPGEVWRNKCEDRYYFVCRVWPERVPSATRLPFRILQFYQNDLSRSALFHTASLKRSWGNLDFWIVHVKPRSSDLSGCSQLLRWTKSWISDWLTDRQEYWPCLNLFCFRNLLKSRGKLDVVTWSEHSETFALYSAFTWCR